jgi:galactan 5-O-arabinofuranosyltransferase
MKAPVGMTVGLLLVGLSGYVYLAVTGHSSTPTEAAALSSLYFLVGLVTLGVFVGLEQETSRSVSRAAAEGRSPGPVTRTAQRHTLWLLGLTLAVLAVGSPLLVQGPLRGQWPLFGALLLAAVSAAAVYLVRGRLGGQQEFVGYSATLATEGLARLVPCVVIYLVAGGVAWAYGVAFAAALAFAALVGTRWLGPTGGPGWRARVGSGSGCGVRRRSESGPDLDAGTRRYDLDFDPAEDRATEISEFETPERSAAGGLALLVAGSMLMQLVANLAPLVASTRLTHADTLAAAFGQAFVLVRIPLLLTAPIQAMLLPSLTRSAAHHDYAALRHRVRLGLLAVAGLGALGTAILAGVGPWALKTFFGSADISHSGTKADLSHRLLAELGVGTVFLMLTAILQPTLVALNRHRLVPLAWGLGAVVLTVLVVLPIDPLDAAAAGSVCGPLTVVLVMALGLTDALRGRTSTNRSDAPERPQPMTAPSIREQSMSRLKALWPFAAEGATALVACLLLPFAARRINVDPVERTGQVSALAALQVRYSAIAIVLVAVLLAAHRLRHGRGYELTKRLVCAAVAGIASGFLAGGIVVALLGSPWPLFGLSGDTGRLVEWSKSIVDGHGNPNPTYPPLTLHALAWWAQLFHGGNTATAFRDFEILGAAVTGPAAYLAWRMVLSPLWALAVGVVPAYAIIDPYKPYGAIVMIVLLPVFVRFVRHTRRVGDQRWRSVLLGALAFGLLYSVLFLSYPGSALWSTPGLAAAVVLTFPWTKDRAKKLGAFLAATIAVFGVLCGWYVKALVGPGTTDRAYGFDAYTDPAFFSMWRTDMPGDVGQWPPPGELAGVGLFSILTFAGIGVALWLGWRRSLITTVACVFVGTWLWRMWFASQMWATQSVQLWPRTGNQLLYCVLVASAFAACLAARKLSSWPPTPARIGAHVGALFSVLMILGSAASSVSDYWMPAKTNSYKILAYVSQTMRKPDGSCPKFAPNHQCSENGDQSWLNNFAPPRNH